MLNYVFWGRQLNIYETFKPELKQTNKQTKPSSAYKSSIIFYMIFERDNQDIL